MAPRLLHGGPMGPGAQIFNLVADYLIPELRRREIRGISDLTATLITIAHLVRLTVTNAARVQIEEWRSHWSGLRAAMSA